MTPRCPSWTRASDCKRRWLARGTARGDRARSSSSKGASPSTGEWPNWAIACNPEVQVICVDGKMAPTSQSKVYFLLNKPDGVVTTASDPQGRTTVLDLVESPVRIFPVGRLDMNTEGLLILTNDGRLAHLLTHPSSGIAKEYLARVEGDPSPGALRRLREGVELDDGVTAVGSGLARE